MTPQNEQHQRELAVLGFIMVSTKAPYLAGDVFGVCPVKAFLHNETRAIAEAVSNLVARGADPDISGVTGELKTLGKLASIGGAGVVGSLAVEHGHDIWTEAGLMEAAASLASEHRKREVQTELSGIMRSVQTPGVPADLIAEELHKAAVALETVEGHTGMTFGQQLDEYVAGLDSPERAAKPVKTPWKGVNGILRGGILPGELGVLAARPSVGKSAFALNLAWSIACSGKKSVLFSLEMPRQQLFDRLVANVGGVDVGRFREGLSARERELAKAAAVKMRGKPFIVSDETRVTTGDIRRRVRMEQRGNQEVGLVVVDYLQLLTAQVRNQNREREVAEMSRALKLMAVELRVPVLILAQLNRKSEESKRPPMLSDLRESGAIEQDADIVIFLHQARQIWHSDEPVRVIVAKGRSSGVGQEHLVFKRKFQRFLDSDEAAFDTAVQGEIEAELAAYREQGQGLL